MSDRVDADLRALREQFRTESQQVPKIFHGLIQSDKAKPPPDFAWGIFPHKVRAPGHIRLETPDSAYRFEHGRFLADDGSDDSLNQAASKFLDLTKRAEECLTRLPRDLADAIPSLTCRKWLELVYWLARIRPNLLLRSTEYSGFFEVSESGEELSPNPEMSSDGYLIFSGKPIQRFHGPALDTDVFTSSAGAIDELLRFGFPASFREGALRVPTSIKEFQADAFRDWVRASRATLAVVFTDIVDSAQLANAVGDEAINEILRAHFDRLNAAADKQLGFVVKNTGDGALITFRTVIEALDFGLDLQGDTGHQQVRVRAGINVGPVRVVEEKDIRGSTVNFASRVCFGSA